MAQVVRPRSAQVVLPTSDFVMDEENQSLTYFAKTGSKGKMAIGLLLTFLLTPVAFVGIFLGMMLNSGQNPMAIAPTMIAVGLCAALGLVLVILWMNKPSIRKVTIDKNTISVGDKAYLLDHVSFIGFHAPSSTYVGGAGAGGIAAVSAAAATQVGSYIYIQYGSDTIPIITGLNPGAVDIVHARLVEFLARFGRNFTSS